MVFYYGTVSLFDPISVLLERYGIRMNMNFWAKICQWQWIRMLLTHINILCCLRNMAHVSLGFKKCNSSVDCTIHCENDMIVTDGRNEEEQLTWEGICSLEIRWSGRVLWLSINSEYRDGAR